MSRLTAIFLAAATSLSCADVIHSFYTGLNFGATHMSGVRNDSAREENNANFSAKKSTRGNGGYGGVLAGYLFRIADFGVGTELFYNYGKIESSASGLLYEPANALSLNFRMKNKISDQHGLGARFGYFLQSYFIYTYLGLQRQFNKYQVFAKGSRNGFLVGDYNFKKKKRTNLFSFGLGTQKSITDHVDVGVEYKTSRFPKKAYTFHLNDIDNTIAKSDFKCRLHTVSVRLIYKF